MGAGASVEGDAPKPKFIYLPVVGRGEQIRLLAAEHDIAYETVLPAGFGGEYNWAEQAPHGTVPVLETTEGFAIGDSAAIVDYILEKTPEGPLAPKDTKARCLAKDAWNFCNDYYSFFLSPMHDVIMNHAEPHWRQGRNTDPRANPEHEKHADFLSELKTLHSQRMGRLQKKLAAAGTAFCAGDECTYADLFIYTCVTTVRFSVSMRAVAAMAFRDSVRPAPSTRRSLRTGAQVQGLHGLPRVVRRGGSLRRLPDGPRARGQGRRAREGRGGGGDL